MSTELSLSQGDLDVLNYMVRYFKKNRHMPRPLEVAKNARNKTRTKAADRVELSKQRTHEHITRLVSQDLLTRTGHGKYAFVEKNLAALSISLK